MPTKIHPGSHVFFYGHLILAFSFLISSPTTTIAQTGVPGYNYQEGYVTTSVERNETLSKFESEVYTFKRTTNQNRSNSIPKNGQWCGKDIQDQVRTGSSKGNFMFPKNITKPFLNLRCTPNLRPYIETDDPRIGSVIVDAALTHYQIDGAVEISDGVQQLQVVIINTRTQKVITSGAVGVNTIGNVINFSLSDLGSPQEDSLEIICQAYSKNEWIAERNLEIDYLPEHKSKQVGGVVRINSESGTLMVLDKKSGQTKNLIPFGFSLVYGSYLTDKELGKIIENFVYCKVNTVRFIPAQRDIQNLDLISSALRKLSDSGLWIQYDMTRFGSDQEMIRKHVSFIKKISNVLIYHTAEEPDGKQFKLDYPGQTGNYVKSLDPYRPNSVTLACENFYFTNYINGSDIIMTNSFTIGFNQSDNNMPYSTVCDNCQGQFLDLVHRMRSFKQRRYFLGKERKMPIWSIPQAMSTDNYTTQAPTGDQFILICSIYLIEGSMGLMGWNENMRMTIELKNAAKTIANVLPTIARFLKYPQSFYPLSKTNPYPKDYFIANLWIDPENNSVLLIAANLGSQEVSWTVNLPKLPFSSDSEPKIRQLYRSNGSTEVQIFGAEKDQLKVNGKLNSYGFGAWEFAFGRRLQGEGIQENITTSK